MRRPDRRTFVLAAGATALTSAADKDAPADRVRLAVIGVRGRGRGVALNFARLSGAQITHVCDVNEPLLAPFAKQVADVQKTTPKCVQDLRDVFADKGVDAVIVATPDHWHALASIWACQAGKHVYVEKPVSHNVFEGRQIVAASRRYKKVVQTGTQSRSVPHYREAIDYVRSGKLGTVHMAKAWNSQLRRRVTAVKDAEVPKGLDWLLWQGPAPERPYNDRRYSYGWRWFWDYGTGDMGNDGVHDLDMPAGASASSRRRRSTAPVTSSSSPATSRRRRTPSSSPSPSRRARPSSSTSSGCGRRTTRRGTRTASRSTAPTPTCSSAAAATR